MSFGTVPTGRLLGELVRVVSNDGQVFQGWAAEIDGDNRHVLLRDAQLIQSGSTVERGTVLVAHADSIEQVEAGPRIAKVALEAIHTSPFHAREFDVEDNRLFVDEVRREGWASSYPSVRVLDQEEGTFEVVEGHKRLWAAAEAGLLEHPVAIERVNRIEGARRFVYDHLPAERHLVGDGDGERHDGWYRDDEIEAAIEALVDVFGPEVSDEWDRVAFNAERLGMEIGEEVADGE